ncbi:pyruvate kinase [Chitinispirillales bacterium ANBcel5]|uniref:pyruvate kinase n=1 Tax=Cellulosispirillum alkaliphilum TaxID=3039283 RepID=UPI002A5379B1|nr:pyruvate kinase [Chitinispirillales bacterium ANBcel5]
MIKLTRKTRIVATLGPASSSKEKLWELMKAGVNVFRINFSHGDLSTKEQLLCDIKEVSSKLEAYPALLADLQGPKIRTGKTEDNRDVYLKSHSEVVVTSENLVCDERAISVDYPTLSEEIGPGQELMVNDGHIHLKVLSLDKARNRINCLVLEGGVYSSHKGVNLPNVDLKIPALTEKDREDLQFILKHNFQYIALSFVRKAQDIKDLREIIESARSHLKIIAKIEKPEAAEHIEEILNVSDGIMVARGDLGVEMSPSLIPVVQKDLIKKANDTGKVVIVATQMLESMIKHPIPTRAESTDVANAIFDGSDAVMLSGETAVGDYAVETVKMMGRIALTAEGSSYYYKEIINLSIRDTHPPHALAEAAVWAAKDLGGVPILLFTISGDTAFYLAKLRNQSPVYAFSPNHNVVRMLSLAWNISSHYLPMAETDTSSLQLSAEEILLKKNHIQKGDLVLNLAGTTPVRGATNILRVKRVGEE